MNQEIQNKYVELQLLNQQIKQIQEQFLILQQQLTELINIETSLTELKDVKKNNEMFSPIGSGIFVSSTIKDNDLVIVNVGAGVLIEKTVDEAKKLVQSQMENINKSIEIAKEQFAKASTFSEELTAEIQAMMQNEKK